jgi:hypothetical protein
MASEADRSGSSFSAIVRSQTIHCQTRIATASKAIAEAMSQTKASVPIATTSLFQAIYFEEVGNDRIHCKDRDSFSIPNNKTPTLVAYFIGIDRNRYQNPRSNWSDLLLVRASERASLERCTLVQSRVKNR